MIGFKRKANTPEHCRLEEALQRKKDWRRWGTYLPERQWATVREDYSADGSCWEYFPFEHSHLRAYRWGDDGLLGFCDRKGRLCFSMALWNGNDEILKERLYGLTANQGNHREDVKEYYFYEAATPTHSYSRAHYKYPHRAFPYKQLQQKNSELGPAAPEYELLDTGIFDENRYFNVEIEYAKGSPNDILIRISVENAGTETARFHLLPTIWFRNTWSWGREGEGYTSKPLLVSDNQYCVLTNHPDLEDFYFTANQDNPGYQSQLFTENETNFSRLYETENLSPYCKDAFNDYLINGNTAAVNPQKQGTKSAFAYQADIAGGAKLEWEFRLFSLNELPTGKIFGDSYNKIMKLRRQEHQKFYEKILPKSMSADDYEIARQSYAGLIWSCQFYHYSVREWLEGDPNYPKPNRRKGLERNTGWKHLYNRDILSMPDKWEYPWYAAWDTAFQMLPMSRVDPDFAADQMILFLREWYMHPNGSLPSYEFAFSDVNPPMHAWACWHTYQSLKEAKKPAFLFLSRAFQKLLLNFTWWVNCKDTDGNNLFSGGFLGLDNVGIFERSFSPGLEVEQADGTAWMAFYCAQMLKIALELAEHDPAYEDLASKFFEHFVGIYDAINLPNGAGLWHKEDGFYYDSLIVNGSKMPCPLRSTVGIIPLLAAEVFNEDRLNKFSSFRKRLDWFVENRDDLAEHLSYSKDPQSKSGKILLSIPDRERLRLALEKILDPQEFLAPGGIRSMSRYHLKNPWVFRREGVEQTVAYIAGEADSEASGGNSNWRGPIWFPINFLLIEALEKYHEFYGDTFKIECPTGSGQQMNLKEVAFYLSECLAGIFREKQDGSRPYMRQEDRQMLAPDWKNFILYHEHFDGDSSRGLGASHQTGWTALVALCLEKLSKPKR